MVVVEVLGLPDDGLGPQIGQMGHDLAQVVTTGPAVLVLNEHAAAAVAIGGQDVCGICRYRYLGALQFQADAQIAGEMV